MQPIKNKKNLMIKSLGALAMFAVILIIFSQSARASVLAEPNIIYLLNQERLSEGLSALNVDLDLMTAARLKSNDMLNRDYFAHYAFGLTPWIFMKNAGYDFMFAGENLAMDFNTSEGAVKAWMASPKHRDNILNPDFQDIGVGVVSGVYTEDGLTHDTVMVTTIFGQKKPGVVKFFESIRKFFSLY